MRAGAAAGKGPGVDNHAKRSTFTWYLTTAPDGALLDIKDYQMDEDELPKRLGTIALDVSVTHSLNHVARGRMSLHSDPNGGDWLLRWYQKRGMAVLPEDKKLPVGPRRWFKPNDGHYCYYTIATAVAESHALDELR